MSYQVLARKWRPHSFEDMVGQEHILRMLTNALDQQRIHHAYLFTGTRGTGKTTLARILAKCLNCEANISANPCGHCNACESIAAGKFLDLYEIDAASRTKVEDTRELLDNVQYPPTGGRFKIYLIDEVHMLSNHSFNALLKTLEEPPAHVKFLLATTDPKRLPITILSRCLQFPLKPLTIPQIATHLAHICNQENIPHDVAALQVLAKAAEGSVRDGLSLLDQAIAFGNGAVNLTDVNRLLGYLAHDQPMNLLTALAEKNVSTLFQHIRTLAEQAPDFAQLLEELISYLHQIALAQFIPQLSTVEPPMHEFAKKFTPEEVQLYYQIALLGRRDLAFHPAPQQGFEMIMLRMLAFQPAPEISSPSKVPLAPLTRSASAATAPTAAEVKTAARLDWRQLLPTLDLSGMAYALAANCTLISDAQDKITLALSKNHLPMLNEKLKERIAEALSRVLNKNIQLEINITTDELLTPVKHHENERELKLAHATQSALENPHVKKLIEMFDATVEVSLLKT